MASNRPLGKALRAAIAVTFTTVLANHVLGFGDVSFYATFGTFILLVFADFGGPPLTRFLAYVLTGFAGLVLIVVGNTVAANVPVALLVTGFVIFALAYLTVLRGYLGAAFVCLLMPFVVAVTTAVPMSELPKAILAYAFGALVAAIAAVTMWPSYSTSEIRKAVGRSLGVAAKLLANTAPLKQDATPAQRDALIREFVAANQALDETFNGKSQRPGYVTKRDRNLVQLIDDISRLRVSLRWPGVDKHEASESDLVLLRATQESLDACSKAICEEGPVPVPDAILEARLQHINHLPEMAGELLEERQSESLQSRVNASFYYRMTGFLTALIVHHTQLALGESSKLSPEELAKYPNAQTLDIFDSATNPGQILRSHFSLSSPWLRHALQTSVGVTIAVALVLLLHINHGFWVVLGIAFSLKLDAGATRKTAVGAIVGTAAGFLIFAGIDWLIQGNESVVIYILPVCVFLATWLPAGKHEFAMRQAGFTILFVLISSMTVGLSLRLGTMRLQDVAIGMVICLFVATVMWPKGVAAEVRSVINHSVEATAQFFSTAYRFITSPMTEDDHREVTTAAHAAVVARIRADDAYDAAISQGGDTGLSAKSWNRVANTVDHVFFAATLVTSLPHYNMAPIPFEDVAARLREDATDTAKLYVESINEIYESKGLKGATRKSGQPVAAPGLDPTVLEPQLDIGHDLRELSDTIEAQIHRCNGCTGDLHYTVDQVQFAMPYGKAVISALWAQEWLLYFYWLASHTVAIAASADDR